MLSVLLVETDSAYVRSDEIPHWRRQSILSFADRHSLVRHLNFDPAASRALIDVLVFLMLTDVTPERATECAAVAKVVGEIRNLPAACCMRDGRKWNRLPAVALSSLTFRGIEHLVAVGASHCFYNGCLFDDDVRHFHAAIRHLHTAVDAYREQVLKSYRKAGILVAYRKGRFQVKWALRETSGDRPENEYYFGPADRRNLADYVTVHRDISGISYEARSFEELINLSGTRERDIQRFFELHPAFLMDAMQGIPIRHRPILKSPSGWTPDFVLPPGAAIRDDHQVAQVAELKGVHVPLLSGRLHRGFSHHVMAAINQVRDYARLLRKPDPIDAEGVFNTFGYLPRRVHKAVIIGRAPRTGADGEILRRRMAEQPDVRIVSYDEILSAQYEQIE